MAQLYLLIDGYNLLFAAGCRSNRDGPGSLQEGRLRLIRDLHSRLDPEIADNTCVVFDGAGNSSAQPEESSLIAARFQIRFSSAGTDADTEIESLLARHSSPRQVLVVSSDHRLHRAAARRGACCMDSEHFLDLLDSHSASALKAAAAKRPSAKPPRQPKSSGKPPIHPDLLEQLADVHEEFLQIDPQTLFSPRRPNARTRRRKN
ncbi:MAG: hypothetical protein RLZZ458_3252 [Planctomycetota bacterium]|jgi:predicted RNA-binding protein with PIN domain